MDGEAMQLSNKVYEEFKFDWQKKWIQRIDSVVLK